MKETIILLVVLLLTFVPNQFFRLYLKESGSELITTIETMQQNLLRGENVTKEIGLQLKEEFWEKEKIWILMVDHDMLDEIENGIEECVAYFDEEHQEEFLAAAMKIIDAVEDLSKREEISLANIL